MDLQCVVRPVAVVRRYVAPHAGSWLDAVAVEPPGTPVRQGAPLPEVPLDEPSRAVLLGGPSPVMVLPGGLRAQPGHRSLFGLVRTSQCSPQSRRHQEETLQRRRCAEA